MFTVLPLSFRELKVIFIEIDILRLRAGDLLRNCMGDDNEFLTDVESLPLSEMLPSKEMFSSTRGAPIFFSTSSADSIFFPRGNRIVMSASVVGNFCVIFGV